jgi:hypothetical protein
MPKRSEFCCKRMVRAEFAIHLEEMMMSRMSLKMKLGVGFGTLLVILALMGVVGYRALTQLVDAAHEVDQIMAKQDMATTVEEAVEKQTTAYAGFCSWAARISVRLVVSAQMVLCLKVVNPKDAKERSQRGKEIFTAGAQKEDAREISISGVEKTKELLIAGKRNKGLRGPSLVRLMSYRFEDDSRCVGRVRPVALRPFPQTRRSG